MQIIQTLTNREKHPLALTIGNFDGVHIGHQAILKSLVSIANQQNYHPAAMTFTPHAKIYFAKNKDFLITDDDEKARLIAKQHIKILYQIPFNAEFSKITASAFIEKLIYPLNVKCLLVGDDFRFGNNGEGDFYLLSKICQRHGITLQHAPTIKHAGVRVSSSQTRAAIKSVDFDLVKALLARPLVFRGEVIKGKQLGRAIDFPTANIRLSDWCILPEGAFVVRVKIKGNKKSYGGMCNIGTKPTLDNQPVRLIEVHLLNFNANLYGKILTIEPLIKIRDEKKFKNIDELIQQLKKDKQFSLQNYS